MKKPQVEALIQKCASIPIVLGNTFKAPSRTADGERSLEKENHQVNYLHPVDTLSTEYYRKIFGHCYYDPRNAHNKEMFDELFMFDSRDLSKCVNTRSGYRSFSEQVMNRSRSDARIVIVAPKGSGKTFFINYFLSQHDKDLYDNRKIPIVVDFFRMYEEFRQTNAGTESEESVGEQTPSPEAAASPANDKPQHTTPQGAYITFDDFLLYINLSTLVKSHLYQHVFPVLKPFWNGAALNMFVDAFNSSTVIAKQFSSPKEFFNTYTRIINKIVRTDASYQPAGEIDLPEGSVARQIASIKMLTNEPGVAETATEFVRVFRTYLKSRGYNVILFLDSLDNLDYFHDHDIYENVIRDVTEVVMSQTDDRRLTSFFVLGVREETYKRLKLANQFFGKIRKRYTLSYPDIATLLETRQTTAREPKSGFLKEMRADYLVLARPEENANYTDFKDESEQYREQSQINTKAKGRSSSSSSPNTRRATFEQRMRNLCTEFVDRMMDSIEFRYKLDPRYSIPEIDFDRDENAFRRFVLEVIYNGNIRSLLHNIVNIHKTVCLMPNARKRQYLYREGQLLNGRFYLDSKSEAFLFGQVLFNFFYFDTAKANGRWHGLCALRIMQSLNMPKISDDLILDVAELFGYEMDILEECLSLLVQHGMVRSGSSSQNQLTLERTSKGTFCFNYVFTDPSILYFIAIDTPLNLDVATGGQRIRIHKNIADERRIFVHLVPAIVMTNIAFIRHILTADREERRGMNKWQNETYRLPAHFPGDIIKEMARRLTSMLEREGESENAASGVVGDLESIANLGIA